MSMLASFTSSIFIVGVPAEIYYYGTMFFFIGVGYALFLPFGAHVFVPIFHKMEMTSANEVSEFISHFLLHGLYTLRGRPLDIQRGRATKNFEINKFFLKNDEKKIFAPWLHVYIALQKM